MKVILANPKVKNKINFESRRFSEMNSELDGNDLRDEIKTLLYMAIRTEFSLALDPIRMEGWLCARIAWRVLDHVSKECDLIYAPNEEDEDEPAYKRVSKVSLSNFDHHQSPLEMHQSVGRGVNRGRTLSTLVSFGDMIPADIERHQTFESFLRKADIKIAHKHVLMYVIALDYSFRELADVYGVSSPTARKIYRRAVEALRRCINNMSAPEQSTVANLLRGVYERE